MTWFALVESNTTGSGRQFCTAARALGLTPVVLCRDPGRYSYLADDGIDVRVVDTARPQALLATARELRADRGLAGVTTSSEYFAAAAARTAARLGLPGPDPDALDRWRRKDLQRARLAEAGVRGPGHHAVTDPAGAVTAARELGLPVVVKPTTGSGSAGVRLCTSAEQAGAHAAALLDAAPDDRTGTTSVVLVEAYLTGREFSVETFDGRAVAVVAKHLGAEPYFVETGHDYPAPICAAQTAGLQVTAEAAVAALGLRWGAAHTELRHDGEAAVVEVNPRLAGGMIPALLTAAGGPDLVTAVVARAAGLATGLDAGPGGEQLAPAGHAAIRFALNRAPGTVTAVHGAEQARARPGVTCCATTAVVGAELAVTGSFRDRFGYAIATGPDARVAADRAALAAADLHLEIRRTDDPHR